MNFTIIFLANIGIILYIFYESYKYSTGIKFLMQILCGYTALEYLIRPLLMYYADSNNIFLTFSDSRFTSNKEFFLQTYLLCLVGNAVLALTFLCVRRKRFENFFINAPNKFNESNFSSFLYFGLICGFLSIITEETKFQNPISKSLTSFGVLSYCLFLWKKNDLVQNFRKSQSVIFHILGSVNIFALYIFTNFSKGPLFAPLLIFVYRSRIWQRKIGKLGYSTISILIAFIALNLFNRLQDRYLGAGYKSLMANTSGRLPWYLDWLRPIANRFDLFNSVSDAYFAGRGALGGFDQFVRYSIDSLLWNPSTGRIEQSYGQIWNQRVTSISLPDAKFSKVSLAQGTTADGWVWFGMKGVVIFNIVFAISVIILGKFLSNSLTSGIFAMSVIGSNVFFESGILQLFRLLSLGAKISLLTWLFLFVIRHRRTLS